MAFQPEGVFDHHKPGWQEACHRHISSRSTIQLIPEANSEGDECSIRMSNVHSSGTGGFVKDNCIFLRTVVDTSVDDSLILK